MSAKAEDARGQTRFGRAWRWVATFLAVVAFWVVVGRMAGGLGSLVLVLALAINVVVHELAHALVAMAAGHNVHVISIGRFAIFPQQKRLTFKYDSHEKTLGHVIHSRPKGDGGRDWSGWITAAGPLSNFALGGLAVVVAGYLSYGDPALSWNTMTIVHSTDSSGAGALGLFALVSLLVGAWSLAYDVEGSDGQKLKRRKEGFGTSDAGRRLATLYAVSQERPPSRRWDDAVVQQLECDEFEREDARVRDHVLVARYLDSGDVRALKRVLGRSQATRECQDPWLILIYAFAIALVDRNGDIAGQWLERMPHDLRRGFEYWRSKAVVDAANGDYGAARAAMAEARKDGTTGDADDAALFAAIENGGPLPVTFTKTPSSTGLSV